MGPPAAQQGSSATVWDSTRMFFAGGTAGAVARTATAPLDRIKLLFQVQWMTGGSLLVTMSEIVPLPTMPVQPGYLTTSKAQPGKGLNSTRAGIQASRDKRDRGSSQPALSNNSI
eukprot:1160722-Pelagomonas_calceolata.AAC.4